MVSLVTYTKVICLLGALVYWEPKLLVLYQGSLLGLIVLQTYGHCSVWVEYIQLHRCQRINTEHATMLQYDSSCAYKYNL